MSTRCAGALTVCFRSPSRGQHECHRTKLWLAIDIEAVVLAGPWDANSLGMSRPSDEAMAQ
ncbi:Protein of unknown function [Micromonospora lupini str. Lupac 08]|uniref:Transposase n=1 Tax=Micromonospora lupini str. Lupac 08 TaxID=1150864 RepID=I0L620_9ACTN|nr:Protein of unknown function [Micromonospora lupini str. Lupac 08]